MEAAGAADLFEGSNGVNIDGLVADHKTRGEAQRHSRDHHVSIEARARRQLAQIELAVQIVEEETLRAARAQRRRQVINQNASQVSITHDTDHARIASPTSSSGEREQWQSRRLETRIGFAPLFRCDCADPAA